MSESWIDELLQDESFRRYIAALQVNEPQKAVIADFPKKLHPQIIELLHRQNINKLFSHQTKAVSSILDGKNTALVTGVASGKSLCYQLPVLQSWLENENSRSLFLFPTKALAQDQKKEMSELIRSLTALTSTKCNGAAIYDGDTPQAQRQKICRQANFIFSNPDMLHLAIMPHHPKWSHFFSELKYVIIDEVHIYRGVFGSQFANVMRRLQRIAAFYGSRIQFIVTSATMTKTEVFLKKLLEKDFFVIEEDGSPQPRRYLLIYNPPLINRELSIRMSSLKVAVQLGRKMYEKKIQTLIFTQTRRVVELIVTYLQRKVDNEKAILGYRSGYLPQQRRLIESRLKSGATNLVVATNALELGIDIGSLEAIIINGFPGSIASTRQEWGRAGRSSSDALGILIASNTLLDQYLVKNPQYLFAGSPEQALINPDNPFILLLQIKCALYEMPFKEDESFGSLTAHETSVYLNLLQKYGKALKTGKSYIWKGDSYPASSISLRTTGAGEFLLSSENNIIGKVDEASVNWMIHPQAVYLHNGISYLVKDLDLVNKRAVLEEKSLDYYTQSISKTDFELTGLEKEEQEKGCKKVLGKVKVHRQVTGFKRIKWGTQEILSQEMLDMPVKTLHTQAFWIALDDDLIKALKDKNILINEPNNYGSGWQKLKNKIRQRDNYTCQVCGVTEKDKAFHVHHKIPFKSFNDRIIANREQNLITLCPACHKIAEQEAYIQSALAGLKWLLQNLVPLFLMCDVKDINVSIDAKSNLTQNKPAVIFYDSAPGGIGLSQRLFSLHKAVIYEARKIVENCECENGCPACTGPAAESGESAKNKVKILLDYLV